VSDFMVGKLPGFINLYRKFLAIGQSLILSTSS